jgi:alpha-galactosidase
MKNDPIDDISRRSLLAGMGAIATSLPLAGMAVPRAAMNTDMNHDSNGFIDILRSPDFVYAYEGKRKIELKATGTNWLEGDVEVTAEPRTARAGTDVPVRVRAPKTELRYLQLRWKGTSLSGTRYLHDSWERAYGDLEWLGMAPNRVMPWYFMAANHVGTHGYGVKTQPNAICFWQIDSDGISLWLDLRNGDAGVQLGDRELEAAVVVARQGKHDENSFSATRSFCSVMCEHPRNASAPIYGGNNWYYAYGHGFGAAEMIRDAEVISSLVSPTETNRPFMVIDMGWADTPDGAGPVSRARTGFPDMKDLAAKMKATGSRPGIWTRPLLSVDSLPESWRMPHNMLSGKVEAPQFLIDPSVPAALEYVKSQMHTIASWGYELIKHDFSTYDLLGRWGFQMGATLTNSGWHFADRSRTTAEIILGFYRGLREAAGDTYLLGCNTIGHLSAGIFEASRIGDDTSGMDWDRTWKMGVNCLAFRGPQHETFFAADADCVPITPEVPWEKTKIWLDLVARSGTPLFVSLDPRSSTIEVTEALKSAFVLAAKPQPLGQPLDWGDTTTPGRWLLNKQEVVYDWSFGASLSPFAG